MTSCVGPSETIVKPAFERADPIARDTEAGPEMRVFVFVFVFAESAVSLISNTGVSSSSMRIRSARETPRTAASWMHLDSEMPLLMAERSLRAAVEGQSSVARGISTPKRN